eukprot:CAMPEP_0172805632 /NCGR_PEP_ID=MMETSP1075-20121228/5862_1 /TAXON_ID=2916 /ORGANISM="Ceratium fusus, Strain PA161109" /LENGTH=392 /DNA_ID=CAMNT_0013644325 /DNA_START=83 /DNA_END=1261 /DNA_ORIENTATION=-
MQAWLCAFGWVKYGSEEHIAMREQWQYEPTAGCALEPPEKQRCGPDEWHLIPAFKACAEQGTQSPIDLELANITAVPMEWQLPNPLRLTSGKCDKLEFELNEHTDEVMFDATCKDRFSVPFIASPSNATEKMFYLNQFHYHSPSEHTLDGKYFPMEVHHVHHAQDGQALVIAVLIAEGEPQNPEEEKRANFLTAVQSLMPHAFKLPEERLREGNVWTMLVEHSHALNAYTDFIDMSGGYFYYDGSFTTPPCTHGTHWIILRKPVKVPTLTISSYRAEINSNPYNQLTAHDNAFPFHADAGNVTWNKSLGDNIRATQPLQGVNNPRRQLYYSAPNANLQQDAGRPLWQTYWLPLAVCILVMLALAYFVWQKFDRKCYGKKGWESDTDEEDVDS